ncbi:putative metalloendopeptidase [Oscillibacter valericigenes Sjm18-20]|nr:putative metalloendopeptidase [Oscillibacter valericigenes Sjm18-20]
MQTLQKSKTFKHFLRMALSLICLFTLLLPNFEPTAKAISQSDIDALQADANKLAAKKKGLQSKLSALSDDKSKVLDKKELLDEQISVLSDQVSNVEDQIADFDHLISQTQTQLDEAKEKEKLQYQLFCKRVRAMEECGTISYWSVLFKANSFTDLLSRLDFVNEIMESDQRVIDDLKKLQDEISAKQNDLKDQKAESESAKADLVAKKSELDTQRKTTVSLMKQIEENEADYKSTLSEIAREEDATNDKIAQMAKELAKQSSAKGTYGGYIWPVTVSKRISSPFGRRTSPGGIGSTNHKGVDICGVGYTTQVLAAKAGTVIISQYSSSYGNYVVINHGGGNATLYAHLSSRKVSVGDTVTQGQVIGITGCTGHSTGPHLHFGITEDGEWVDPLKYLSDYTKAW